MNRENIINFLVSKTRFSKEKLLATKINEGKIELKYLRSLIEELKTKTFRNEFYKDSKYSWNLYANVSIEQIVNLFSFYPEKAAEIRANIIYPPVSRATVISYLKDITEKDFNENDALNSLTLNICNNNCYSYITIICWCNKMFRKNMNPNVSRYTKISDFIDFYIQ